VAGAGRVIARGRGDIESAERHCAEALASLPAERSGPRLLCLSSLSNLAIVRGDGWRARALNREALEQAQRFGNPLFEALVHYDRARGCRRVANCAAPTRKWSWAWRGCPACRRIGAMPCAVGC
jgi:ATP/maltotriose-dependent transcriptional regulator MalT